MTESPIPGRSIVTRRALVDLVRAAVLGSYGVIGLTDRRRVGRWLGALGLGQRGITASLRDGISIELSVTVAHGLPIAEVARQLDSAVRYAVRRAVGREVDRLVIHVNGLKVLPSSPRRRDSPEVAAEGPGPEPAGDGVVRLSTFARRRVAFRRSAAGRSR